MMREIKFRAWDKEDNIMRSWLDCQYFGWNLHEMFEQDLENYPIMQYTGLKDKNGKEIYEGDIVKGKAYEFRDNPTINGEVVYNYGSFMVKSTTDNDSKIKAMLNTTYEVIGNIYENPKSLNA